MESMMLLFTTGPVPTGPHRIPLGVADIKRPGNDVSLVTWGWQVQESLGAAEILAAEGTSVEVVDVRSLVPLDRAAILNSVAKTGRCVVVHAATKFAGPARRLPPSPERVVGPTSWPRRTTRRRLCPDPVRRRVEQALYPNQRTIADAIRKMG